MDKLVEINVNGLVRRYRYDPNQDYNLILQDMVEVVAEYEDVVNKDHADDQMVNL